MSSGFAQGAVELQLKHNSRNGFRGSATFREIPRNRRSPSLKVKRGLTQLFDEKLDLARVYAQTRAHR